MLPVRSLSFLQIKPFKISQFSNNQLSAQTMLGVVTDLKFGKGKEVLNKSNEIYFVSLSRVV